MLKVTPPRDLINLIIQTNTVHLISNLRDVHLPQLSVKHFLLAFTIYNVLIFMAGPLLWPSKKGLKTAECEKNICRHVCQTCCTKKLSLVLDPVTLVLLTLPIHLALR